MCHQVTKKVKSVQMFRKPVSGAMQGDRVGVCVTQFDPKLLERGVVCTPGSLRTLYAAVISVRKIGYFKGSLATRAKFHITVGHETVMARVNFFGMPPVDISESVSDAEPHPQPCSLEKAFTFDREYFYQDDYVTGQGESSSGLDPEQWALLEFERPVTCPLHCLVIGSKLDTDIHANACRLAFQGRLLQGFEDKGYAETTLPRLRIYKTKHKEGQVERVSGHSKDVLLSESLFLTIYLALASLPSLSPCTPAGSSSLHVSHCWWQWSMTLRQSLFCIFINWRKNKHAYAALVSSVWGLCGYACLSRRCVTEVCVGGRLTPLALSSCQRLALFGHTWVAQEYPHGSEFTWFFPRFSLAQHLPLSHSASLSHTHIVVFVIVWLCCFLRSSSYELQTLINTAKSWT